MTDFNPNYNNAELLDQELTAAELSQVSGGLVRTDTFEFLHQAVKEILSKVSNDRDLFLL